MRVSQMTWIRYFVKKGLLQHAADLFTFFYRELVFPFTAREIYRPAVVLRAANSKIQMIAGGNHTLIHLDVRRTSTGRKKPRLFSRGLVFALAVFAVRATILCR